jgi:hypothetical protein
MIFPGPGPWIQTPEDFRPPVYRLKFFYGGSYAVI